MMSLMSKAVLTNEHPQPSPVTILDNIKKVHDFNFTRIKEKNHKELYTDIRCKSCTSYSRL